MENKILSASIIVCGSVVGSVIIVIIGAAATLY
jgi:hypothetical protein